MNSEVKEALKVLIESNLNKDDIDKMFEEFKKSRQENYEFTKGKEFYWANNRGAITYSLQYGGEAEKELIENFNAFPEHKKKHLEYLTKKQLLERKLFVYSDLHGAHKIDWNNTSVKKYCIIATLNNNNNFHAFVENVNFVSHFNCVYFNSKENAQKALDDNKELIKEVLAMQRELYSHNIDQYESPKAIEF
jgi:hypothetical protein